VGGTDAWGRPGASEEDPVSVEFSISYVLMLTIVAALHPKFTHSLSPLAPDFGWIVIRNRGKEEEANIASSCLILGGLSSGTEEKRKKQT
jgi:hypothetical protein